MGCMNRNVAAITKNKKYGTLDSYLSEVSDIGRTNAEKRLLSFEKHEGLFIPDQKTLL